MNAVVVVKSVDMRRIVVLSEEDGQTVNAPSVKLLMWADKIDEIVRPHLIERSYFIRFEALCLT
uniref:Dehydrogenase n=1 Tax=uncultured bacterium pAB4 TaxID=1444979 RepID=W5VJL2_9BACT|nr:dehydrogenase [uncultured bacterium pAB4]